MKGEKIMGHGGGEDRTKLKVTFGNETDRPVRLWLEPLCHSAKVEPSRTLDFDSNLLGGGNEETDVAKAFSKIKIKVEQNSNVPPEGQEIEIYLSEEADGTLRLTLWLDSTHAVGHDETSGEKDGKRAKVSRQSVKKLLGLG